MTFCTLAGSVSICSAIIAVAALPCCGKSTVEHEVEHPSFFQATPAPISTPYPSATATITPSPVTNQELTFVPVSDVPPPVSDVAPKATVAPKAQIVVKPNVTVNAETPVVNAPVPPSRRLFVVISGNGTCNPQRNSRVLRNLWSTDTFDYFVGEVMNRNLVAAQDEVLFICYERDSSQMNFYSLRRSPYMQRLHESQVDSIVVQHAKGFNQLIIIGYSWGGWRGMKLASSPMIAAQIPEPYLLATIDPISRIFCQGLFDTGCHESPRDMTPLELNTLHKRTKWINFYQTSGMILSSGSVPLAKNFNVNANHLSIARSSDVWWNIVPFLAQNLYR